MAVIGSIVNSPKAKEKVETEEKVLIKQNKKARKRKKGIYRRLVKQMEFYFSDANLRHSKFLLSLYDQDPWIPLTTFLTFNMVVNMLGEIFSSTSAEDASQEEKVAELVKALSVVESNTIVLSECKTKVGRLTPFIPTTSSQADNQTIYVENLPAEADHSYLRNFFATYGEVLYVSVPKFKSGRSKGFAFVEFSSPEVVGKVLTDLRSVEVNNSGDLTSVRTYNEEEGEKKSKGVKRKLEETEKGMKVKKAKTTDSPSNVNDQCGDTSEQTADVSVEKQVSDLKVLSKAQWKKLRNKYLNEQRKNFAVVKNSLRKGRISHVKEKVELASEVEKSNEKMSKEERKEIKLGVIVKIVIPEGVDNIQEIKQKVRAGLDGESVAYVDGKVGSETVFIRCIDQGQACKLAGAELSDTWQAKIICGNEEQDYHQKIEKDKQEKRSGKVVVKKVKNKVKLIQKAESVKRSHVYFD